MYLHILSLIYIDLNFQIELNCHLVKHIALVIKITATIVV